MIYEKNSLKHLVVVHAVFIRRHLSSLVLVLIWFKNPKFIKFEIKFKFKFEFFNKNPTLYTFGPARTTNGYLREFVEIEVEGKGITTIHNYFGF